MSTTYRNVHGREAGRGIRPWLLIPKYLCVSVYFGALAAMAVGMAFSRIGPIHAYASVQEATRLFWWVVPIVGGGAAVLGVALWLQHPRVFLRMRWFVVKMLLVFMALPLAEAVLYLSMRRDLEGRTPAMVISANVAFHESAFQPGPLRMWATVGTAVIAIVVLAVIIILGRLKPRLGQKVTTVAEQRGEHSPGDAT